MAKTKKRASKEKKNAQKKKLAREKHYGVRVISKTLGYSRHDNGDGYDESRSEETIGIKVDEDNPTIATKFKIVPENDYYLVTVTYSTGDSFNRSSGHVDYVDLFETKAPAHALAKALNEFNPDTNPNPKREFAERYTLKCGGKTYCVVHLFGHFEHISSVRVETVNITYERDN